MTRSKAKWPRRVVNGQRLRNFQRKPQKARHRRKRRRRRRKGPKYTKPPPPPPPPPPVQFLVPQPQVSHEIGHDDGALNCPESGSLSGFTFVNFVLSAIAVGANIVSNANR